MNPSFSTQILLPRALEPGHLALIRSAGFEYVEIIAEPGHFPYRDAAAVEEWKARFDSAGLQISSIQLPRNLPSLSPDAAERDRAMDELEAAIDAAEALGARLVILQIEPVQIGSAPLDNTTDRAGADPARQTFCEDAIARLSGYASPRGLELACENANTLLTRVPALATSIENVGRSMVGVCVDTGAANLDGNIPAAIRAAGRELYHLQINDNDSHAATGAPVGAGTVPWNDVFAALREVNYSGFFVLEITDASAGAASVESLVSILKESAEKLRSFV
ncbi:MAG: sugar phosphate isomerase/epimerase family protein [Planctomycetota bacterium]